MQLNKSGLYHKQKDEERKIETLELLKETYIHFHGRKEGTPSGFNFKPRPPNLEQEKTLKSGPLLQKGRGNSK